MKHADIFIRCARNIHTCALFDLFLWDKEVHKRSLIEFQEQFKFFMNKLKLPGGFWTDGIEFETLINGGFS